MSDNDDERFDDDEQNLSMGSDNGSDEDDNYLADDWIDEASEKPQSKQKEFKVLDVEQLINNQQAEVLHASEVLGIPVSIAGACLRAYSWDKEKLFTDFFDEEARKKVCKKAKVNLDDFSLKKGDPKKIMECGCCLEDYSGDQMLALSCGHFLCRTCWKGYLSTAIRDGPSCLHTQCPAPKCGVIVDETLTKELVDANMFKLYSKYLSRSFVDDNPHVRWCPAPDCGRAVYCPEGITDVVVCVCGNKFCFKCSREAHAPASCDSMTAWIKKEKDESETANWLTANTKDCPKCRKSTEKNGGCNHMTCSMCKYEYCWVCMDDWTKHGSNTGGYYKCNRYKPEELNTKLNEGAKESARAALEKYMHYYKRYANHDRSQKFEKQLREKAEEKMKELQQINRYSSWVEIEYIQRGVDQLIECRRSLKYTYVHGYYLKDGAEKDLFEYLQEDLERVTEKLSEILEGPAEKFNRDEIIATTKSAEKRLEHLLAGVQQGLTKS